MTSRNSRDQVVHVAGAAHVDIGLLNEIFRCDGKHSGQQMLLIDSKRVKLRRVEVFPGDYWQIWMIMLCVSSHKHVNEIRFEITFSNQSVRIDTKVEAIHGVASTKTVGLVDSAYGPWSQVLSASTLQLVRLSVSNFSQQLPCIGRVSWNTQRAVWLGQGFVFIVRRHIRLRCIILRTCLIGCVMRRRRCDLWLEVTKVFLDGRQGVHSR